MSLCSQCGSSAMYEVQGHLLCLDCYAKWQQASAAMQQANNEKMAQLMAYQNYLVESMAWQAGLSSTPPRLRIPQPIHAVNKGPILNNINIDRSVIGMLNAGQIRDVQNIEINVSALVESGNPEVAQALKAITEVVAASKEISNEQRTELLDQLDELSSQAALIPDKRAKPGVIKAILSGLSVGLSGAGGLAEVWSTWGATIKAFFGV